MSTPNKPFSLTPAKKLGQFVGKTYEFFNRFVPVAISRSGDEGYYLYGADDLLPNNNLKMINDCGVAKRCVRKKSRYIQGDGFADVAVGKMPVNATQTADGLLQQISSYAAYNEGFALQIRRNAEVKIVDVKCIPFECVRKKIDGTFIYNPGKGQPTWDKKKDTLHPAFNPFITIEEYRKNLIDFKQQPEILYVYEQTADNPHYPVPDYNAGQEDIQTCIEISKVDLECVQNGFMPSGIFTTHEIDNVIKDDQGKTPYEYFQEELKKFSGQTKDHNGKGGRFKLFHVMVNSLAEAPKLENYDAKPILEASNTKRDILAREVCRLFGVNPILAGFSDAQVLGNQQALANCVAEFNQYVSPTQTMIQRAFTVLFPKEDWTISKYVPINYIPERVWEKLTDDEIRALAGYEPIVKDVDAETESTINAINTLSPLVANKVMDNLTVDEIRDIVSLPPLVDGGAIPEQQPATNGTRN